jgi:hypothetical protein
MSKDFRDPSHAAQPPEIAKVDWKRFYDEFRPLLERAREVPELERAEIQEKLERGGDRLERVMEGDRSFFDRHKQRNYLLRLAAPIEIEQHELVARSPRTKRRGMKAFTLVKQIGPGVRFRMLITLPETTDPDISERECEGILERAFAEIRDRGQQ